MGRLEALALAGLLTSCNQVPTQEATAKPTGGVEQKGIRLISENLRQAPECPIQEDGSQFYQNTTEGVSCLTAKQIANFREQITNGSGIIIMDSSTFNKNNEPDGKGGFFSTGNLTPKTEDVNPVAHQDANAILTTSLGIQCNDGIKTRINTVATQDGLSVEVKRINNPNNCENPLIFSATTNGGGKQYPNIMREIRESFVLTKDGILQFTPTLPFSREGNTGEVFSYSAGVNDKAIQGLATDYDTRATRK